MSPIGDETPGTITGRPLAGCRVLCFEHAWAGPYASMMLADMAADVVKVEPPEDGDHMRTFTRDDLHGHSPHFLAANRNKRSVALDLKAEAGQRTALDLAARADVVLENYRPGVMERLGVGYDDVRARNEGIVYTSVSGYGHEGPYAGRPANDLLIQGEGGIMSVTGADEGQHAKVGVPVVDLMAAMVAAFSTVCAVMALRNTGQGQRIDISMLQVSASAMGFNLIDYSMSGNKAGPMGVAHPLLAPYQVYETATSPITLGIANDRHWRTFCRVIGRESLSSSEPYRSPELRRTNRESLNAELRPILLERSAAAWVDILNEHGLPCGHVNDVQALLDHPQLAMQDFFRTFEAGGIPFSLPGMPWGFERDWSECATLPPTLGEHTDDVLGEWLQPEGDR